MNISVLKRLILILLFVVGLILFIDGFFLHKINTDVHIVIANHHIHHWMYGLVIMVFAAVGLLFILLRKVKRKAP